MRKTFLVTTLFLFLIGCSPTVSRGRVAINAWTVSFVDQSTGTTALPSNAITVYWGDGTVDKGDAGSVFTHTYTKASPYKILHNVYDGKWTSTRSLTVFVPQTFTVSGTVPSGTTLSLRKNGRVVKILKESQTGGGTYSFTEVIPGCNYTIHAYREGVNFNNPAVPEFCVSDDVTQHIAPKASISE